MKASTHAGESGAWETRWASVVGTQVSRRRREVGAPGCRRLRVASTGRAAPLAARARISSRAARCTDRFAKPSVMQGVPLPTRGCSCAAGRKSGTRRSGAGARAAATRPADSSEVPVSVVSVSLLERWNCVAQVLRLQRDYFKLDNYRGHDLDPRSGVECNPRSLYIHTCVTWHVQHHGAYHVFNIHNPITHIAVHANLKHICIKSECMYLYVYTLHILFLY